ncbi:hypothetical protein XENTR_v10002694 [Xenopus tropicalis]|nr:hypothetical protein XENTR_v10002694 [Xenopus tropicalis]
MQNCTEGRVGSALNITIGDETVEYIIAVLTKCLHNNKCANLKVVSSICKHAKKMHCGSYYHDIISFCNEPHPEHHFSHKHKNCKTHCKELAIFKQLFQILLLSTD